MQICPKSLSNDFAVALACASLSHTWEVTKTFSQARILLWGGQAEMERNPGKKDFTWFGLANRSTLFLT